MGPSGPEDAFHIWNQLKTKRPSLLELSQAISWEPLTQSPFHLFASSLRVPLSLDAGIIARTALEKRGFNIQELAQPDPKVHPEYEGRLGVRAFATVPLLAKDKIIGVILVDNLYNGRPIAEDDLRFLATLANQAGMAIEAARLYSHLEEANRQLQESHHQIVQLERLATLGEMSAMVAHQIRNPLVSIGGFARRLSQLTPEKADRHKYLDIIQKEVKRLEEMVKELLTVSPEVRLRFSLADLNQIVHECLILHEERIKRQMVNLHIQLERKLPKIFLDATRMRQALSNLLDNALDVMPNGGDLYVSTFASAEAAHLEVADTGPGIAPENLQTIFAPFFTTKVDGIGLGLTLTQRVISHHRGNIEARNLPERGAVFSISLPSSVNPLTLQSGRGGD
jgi:signal transduction histidine kinase